MKRIFALPNVRLALEAALVIALVAVLLSNSLATRADSPQTPDALYWYVCNAPNHVGVYSERVHIYCGTTSPVGGAPVLDSAIHWFAVSTAPDSAGASRFMSLLQTSVITAKPIWLWVDPADTSGGSIGCNPADCRMIWGMEMR
jgi:hypothetical protein